MVSAASRIRARHIFDRKWKLSSCSTTNRGRSTASRSANADSSSASIASNTATS